MCRDYGFEVNAYHRLTTSKFLTCGYAVSVAIADQIQNVGAELFELARADTRYGH